MAEYILTSSVNWLQAKVVYTVNSQVPKELKSYVSATLYVKKGTGTQATTNLRGAVSLGGGMYHNGSNSFVLTDEWKEISSKSNCPVYHNEDGTKTVEVKCYVYTNDSSQTKYATVNDSFVLPTIDRASTIYATSTDFGSDTYIKITSLSDNFTHTLKYSFKGEKETALTGTIIEKSNLDSVKWEIPMDLLYQIPNSRSGVITLYCETYQGNSKVGTIKTTTLTATAPYDLCYPSMTGNIYDINNTTLALTGNNKKLIRYHSTAKVNTTPSGKYGASIASMIIKNGSKTIEGNSGEIDKPETQVFTFTIKDSRGYAKTYTSYADMIDYINISCYIGTERPTADGKYNFTVKGNYFNSSFGAQNNTLTVKYRWKDNAASSFSDWLDFDEILTEINTYKAVDEIVGLEYQKTYYFQAKAYDLLTSAESSIEAIKSKPVFDWSKEDFAFNVPVSIQGKPVYVEEELYFNEENSDASKRNSVILSESFNNFDYLEIYYYDNNANGYGYTKVYKPKNNLDLHLSLIQHNTDNGIYIRDSWFILKNNNEIQFQHGGFHLFSTSAITNYSVVNNIKIFRVTGLRGLKV